MYCFKIFYTLEPSTRFKITPTCFGPTGPSSGSTSFLPQSYHWSHFSTLQCGSAAAFLCEVLGYVHAGVILKLILMCVEGFKV